MKLATALAIPALLGLSVSQNTPYGSSGKPFHWRYLGNPSPTPSPSAPGVLPEPGMPDDVREQMLRRIPQRPDGQPASNAPSLTPEYQDLRSRSKDISVRKREWQLRLLHAIQAGDSTPVDVLFMVFWSKYPARFTGKVICHFGGVYCSTMSTLPGELVLFSREAGSPPVGIGSLVDVVGFNQMYGFTPRDIRMRVEPYNQAIWLRGVAPRSSSISSIFSQCDILVQR